MNETLGQLFETLSNLEPTTSGGIAIAALSVGYFVYHMKKNKKVNEKNEEVISEKEASKDVNEITMETKHFDVDYDEHTAEHSFRDLDDFPKKPRDEKNTPSFFQHKNIEHDLDNSSSDTLESGSVLADHNSAIDFIEESNKQLNNEEKEISKEDTQFASIPDIELTQFQAIDIEIPKEETKTETYDLFVKNSQDENIDEKSLSNNSEADELLNFAIESDSFGNKKDALTYLHQAIQTENNLTERVRLKIILQTYENTNKPLRIIIDDIPTIKKVQELTAKKTAPIRFIKADDLKFVDDERGLAEEPASSNIEEQNVEKVISNEEHEPSLTNKDFDISSLLAIPQADVKNDHQAILSGEDINNKVKDAMENIPSLTDVTFRNVDKNDLNSKDHLEDFLETLATDIEKDNLKHEETTQVDNALTEALLSEVNNLPSIESVNNGISSSIETEHKEENSEQTNNLASLNFNELSAVDTTNQTEQVVTKVWVNLIIQGNNSNGKNEPIFVNKKFQINYPFPSIEGNTSINRQINAWVKQTYQTTSYSVTMILPVL